ncbi:MAG: hypothetical protein ACREBR_03910 [bacterium]
MGSHKLSSFRLESPGLNTLSAKPAWDISKGAAFVSCRPAVETLMAAMAGGNSKSPGEFSCSGLTSLFFPPRAPLCGASHP